jgi:opacity protein-like surface antigen
MTFLTSVRTVAGAVLFALLVGAAHAAQAQMTNTGFYGQIAGGLNMPIDSNANSVTGGTVTPTNVRFRTGYNILGAVGIKWDSGFRTELEAGYRAADVHQLANLPASGSQAVLSASGNVLYEFDTAVVRPYLGAGLGVSHIDWGQVYASISTPNFDGTHTSLQYQFIGGVGTRFTDATLLFVEYRYIGSGTASFPSSVGAILQNHHDHSNNALVGLRFFF